MDINVTQIFIESYINATKEVIMLFLTNKYVVGAIASSIVGWFICHNVEKISYAWNMLCGCSKREAKKKAKRNRNIADVVMSIKDLNSKKD